jgi:VWFA-related protein
MDERDIAMNRKMLIKIGLISAALIAACTFEATTQAKSAAEPALVTMTVTAVGKKDAPPPPLAKDDVELYQGKERMQVADWHKGEALLLAIVIDDSLGSNIASQWNDLKAFIMEQPATTSVGVFYGRNGTVAVAQDFTADHALAAKALRIPYGGAGAFSSPYLELQDMIKRWPDNNQDVRKSIVMISSGVDYFRGNFGPTSPDLDPTIDRAQKSNVNVWTIYAPDAGHAGRGFFRSFNAQSSLSQLSEETGAESYYLGFGQPVTLKPYFDEIFTHLSNQYLLSFSSGNEGGKKGRFERVRVATENPSVEFLTPSEVFIPRAEQ